MRKYTRKRLHSISSVFVIVTYSLHLLHIVIILLDCHLVTCIVQCLPLLHVVTYCLHLVTHGPQFDTYGLLFITYSK